MPVVITTLATGESLTASRMNGIFKQVQDYLNGNIDAQDITANTQITEREIVKPEFYGSPAPRTLLATADVHYRTELDFTRSQIYTNHISSEFVSIPGLSCTFYCDQGSRKAIVNSTFSARERLLFHKTGGSGASKRETLSSSNMNEVFEVQGLIAAEFALFVNDVQIDGTSQRSSGTPAEDMTMKNLSICCMVDLIEGENNVSIKVRPTTDAQGAYINAGEFFHIYVSFKQLYVEALLR